MKKLLTLAFLVLFSFLIIPTSYALNTNAYMIITNPGENVSSMMNVSWHMDLGVVNGKIEYTTKDDINWSNATTINADYKEVSLFNNRKFLKYSVSLYNLSKDTEYKYRVGSDVLSETYYFKTAGADEFSFVWVGDWHSYLPLPNRTTNVTNMINKAIEVDPDVDFLLSTGDKVAYGSDYAAWLDLYSNKQYKNFMWATAIGNHDAMNNDGGSNTDGFFASVNNYPKNGYTGQEGKTYYFKYGNSLFLVLNTENMSDGLNRIRTQNWAKEVIQNNPSDYIFVSMHYNWFSGQTGSNLEYNNWKSFFDANGVDLAMSGHNHIYVRTHRLYKDSPATDKGTVYMQSPSSDNDRGRSITGIVNNTDKILKTWTEDANTVGAVLVTVSEDKINTKLIDRSGTIKDESNIPARKKEEVSFSKTEFLESIMYIPSTIDTNSGIIHSSVSGVGNIERIEYYNGAKLLATNYYYQKTNSSFKLTVFSADVIKVKVFFCDGTNDVVDIKVVNKDYYRISDLEVVIESSKYKLSWNYTGTSSIKAWVFIGEVPYKEIYLSDKGVFLDEVTKDSEISIRPSNDSLNKYYVSKYHVYGDADFNGKIDLKDISLLQDYLLGKNNVSADDLDFLDIDIDGKLSMIDITYIHLYITGLVDSLAKTEYNVHFMNYIGILKNTSKVIVNEEAEYINVDTPSGYKFIGWNKDLSSINTDLFVFPIFEYLGDTQVVYFGDNNG